MRIGYISLNLITVYSIHCIFVAHLTLQPCSFLAQEGELALSLHNRLVVGLAVYTFPACN